jgi:hydroxymethylpyrimidine pyrophosphatase-like HAD family hydrolase
MFRLLAFDLDGTLLESDGSLAESSVAGLRRLSQRGVELVPATGRRLWSTLPLLARAQLGGTCVVHNGAMVADVGSATALRLRELAPPLVRSLVATLQSRGFAPLVFTAAPRGPGEVLAQEGSPDPTGYLAWYFRYASGHFTKLPQLSAAPFEGALRVVTHGRREALEELIRDVLAQHGGTSAPLRAFVQRELVVDSFRAEFLSAAADKWSGVRWVAAQRAIAEHQIVAVGDGENDVEMLRGAGHSLAAPGASASARSHAREAIEGDGPRAVVAALERWFARFARG